MKIWLLVLITASVSLSAVAQTMFKFGVERTRFSNDMTVFSKAFSMLSSPYVLCGLGMYGIGTVMWLFALRSLDLSVAYPFVALSFVFVAVLSVVFLGETLTSTRILGTFLIITGLVVVFLGEA